MNSKSETIVLESFELLQEWAEKNNIPTDQIKNITWSLKFCNSQQAFCELTGVNNELKK